MKNYAYMIFLTILSHLEPSQFTLKRWLPAWSPTLNFWVPFALVTPIFVIAYWYYYPFNPYKPYVCECRSVCVCECVSVGVCEYVCVCACEYVCVKKSKKSQKNSKNLKKFKKSQNI
jgi:hypothetical protein